MNHDLIAKILVRLSVLIIALLVAGCGIVALEIEARHVGTRL